MNDPIILSVANDFSVTPGSRYRSEGPFSAEEFMDKLLRNRFEQALSEGRRLVVNLDGVIGYATSFLQGAFGNLAHEFGPEVVKAKLEVISEDDPYLLKYISRYIAQANKTQELAA